MNRLCLALCAAAFAALPVQPADARDRAKERRERSELRRDSRPERDESPAATAAALAVKANGGGRVLAVDRADGGYRVKVLKDGEVRIHQITLE